MLDREYNFTITTSDAHPGFFETSTPDACKLLSSRYWETRMPHISADLVDQVFSCVSTFDLDEANE